MNEAGLLYRISIKDPYIAYPFATERAAANFHDEEARPGFR
jgi:hypothetical protein